MCKIRLSKRALEEAQRLNTLKRYLRVAKSSTSVVYQEVGSVGKNDEIVYCGDAVILVDAGSSHYFDGAEIYYSDNPGWTYIKPA